MGGLIGAVSSYSPVPSKKKDEKAAVAREQENPNLWDDSRHAGSPSGDGRPGAGAKNSVKTKG